MKSGCLQLHIDGRFMPFSNRVYSSRCLNLHYFCTNTSGDVCWDKK